MKPIKFKEANKTLLPPAGVLPTECVSLDVYANGETLISKWKMSWKERLSGLIFGTVWLGVLSKTTQPPVYVVCERTRFIKQKKGKK